MANRKQQLLNTHQSFLANDQGLQQLAEASPSLRRATMVSMSGIQSLKTSQQFKGDNDLLADRMFRHHARMNRGKSATRQVGSYKRGLLDSRLFNQHHQYNDGIFSPQPEYIDATAQSLNENALTLSKNYAIHSQNHHMTLQTNESSNQILYGDVSHSTKLKNLLRGSTKYQDKLNTIVNSFEKSPSDYEMKNAKYSTKPAPNQSSKKPLHSDPLHINLMRNSANTIEAQNLFSGAKENMNTQQFLSNETNRGQRIRIPIMANFANEQYYNSFLHHQFYQKPQQYSPTELRQNNKSKNEKMQYETMPHPDMIRDNKSAQNKIYPNMREATSPPQNVRYQNVSSNSMLMQRPFHNYIDQQSLIGHNIGNLMMFQEYSNHDNPLAITTHQTQIKETTNSNDGSSQVVNRASACPQLQVYAILNQFSDSKTSSIQNKQDLSFQNEQLNQTQNELDLEVQPWQSKRLESQNTVTTQQPTRNGTNMGLSGPPSLPSNDFSKQAKLQEFALINANHPIQDDYKFQYFTKRQEQAHTTLSNRIFTHTLTPVFHLNNQVSKQHSKNESNTAPDQMTPDPKIEAYQMQQILKLDCLDTDQQNENHLAAPSNEEDYFEQHTLTHMQPTNNQERKSQRKNEGPAIASQNRRQQIERDNTNSHSSIKEALIAEIDQLEQFAKYQRRMDNPGKKDDLIQIFGHNLQQSPESKEFNNFFKNRRPESIAKIMAQAQAQSSNRYKSHFRGAKLVSKSAWNRRNATLSNSQNQNLSSKNCQKQVNFTIQDEDQGNNTQVLQDQLRQEQQKLLLNTGYCQIVDKIRAKRAFQRKSQGQKLNQWLNTAKFKHSLKKKEKVITHIPQQVWSQRSPNSPISNQNSPKIKNLRNEKMQMNHTTQFQAIASTNQTISINNHLKKPSERISIELRKINENELMKNMKMRLQSSDGQRKSAVHAAETKQTNTNHFSSNYEQQSLQLQQESVQTKNLPFKMNSQAQYGKRSLKSQSIYSSVSNMHQNTNSNKVDPLNESQKRQRAISSGSSGLNQEKTKQRQKLISSPPNNTQFPLRGSIDKYYRNDYQKRYESQRHIVESKDCNQIRGFTKIDQFANVQQINSSPVRTKQLSLKNTLEKKQKIQVRTFANASEVLTAAFDKKVKQYTESPSFKNMKNNSGESSLKNAKMVISQSKISQASKLSKQPPKLDLSNEFQKIKAGTRSSKDPSSNANVAEKMTVQEMQIQNCKIKSKQQIEPRTNSKEINKRADSVADKRKTAYLITQANKEIRISGQKIELNRNRSKENTPMEIIAKNDNYNGQSRQQVQRFSPASQNLQDQNWQDNKKQYQQNEQNLDLSKVKFNENQIHNDVSQALSDESNQSPLVIQKAVMNNLINRGNLNDNKQFTSEDLLTNIQIFNEHQLDNSVSSKNQQTKTQQHIIDDIMSEQMQNLDLQLNQGLAQLTQNPIFLSDQDKAEQTVERPSPLQAAQNQQRESGIRQNISNAETIVVPIRDGTGGARTSRNRRTGDQHSEIFQFNLSKSQQSSARNHILHSWRASISKSNNAESKEILGQNNKADASQTTNLNKFEQTHDMVLDSHTGLSKSQFQNTLVRRTMDLKSPPKSRSSNKKSRTLNQSPAEDDERKIDQGSYVKQTQHHLRVNIGSKEAVHQTTTQIHPTVAQDKQEKQKPTLKIKGESQMTIFEIVSHMQMQGSPMSQGQMSSAQNMDSLRINGHRIKIKEKIGNQRIYSPSSIGHHDKKFRQILPEERFKNQRASQAEQKLPAFGIMTRKQTNTNQYKQRQPIL